jgi:hypothetical protein
MNMPDAERISQTKTRWPWWAWLLALVAFALVVTSLAAALMNWPGMDEGNYLLQSLRLAQGQLPYRDFYDFITPGGQLFNALLIRLNGFSVMGIRLFVLVGWLVEMLLIYDMARERLSRPWAGLLMAFLWLTCSRYPISQHHFYSGFMALLAVYWVWRYLGTLYRNENGRHFLLGAGLMTALTFWCTQSLGILMALALACFSWLHCCLHEREEKGITFRNVARSDVMRRWWKHWGVYWLLPMLAVHAAWLGSFMALGILGDFARDSLSWLGGGHYQQTTVFGYYPTFHQEFMETIRPFLDHVRMPYLLLFIVRLPIAFHLFLIGFLPVLGILVTGYRLPNRFLYRLLRREDEALLLFLLAAIAMIASTFSYSSSMHIVSNGMLALMLGWLVVYDWVSAWPARDWSMRIVTTALCIALLLGAVIGSLLQWLGGVWLPHFRGMSEPLLYTDTQTNAVQLLSVINLLEEAKAKGGSVFVFSETPSLYLPGAYRNATRFTLILPFYTSPEQLREIFADLERNKPLYIVDDEARLHLYQDSRFSQYPVRKLEMPEMMAYLHQHYRLKTVAGRFMVYQRIEDRK